jgi:hypothetical protein
MTKQLALEYLQEYYNDNYVSAGETESFDEVLAMIGDTLDMLSEDMAEAYNIYTKE